MPTLFLHGGAPKTGTSYIQVVLAQQAERLAEAGLLYPAGHLFEAARRGSVTSGNGVEMANYINPNLPHRIADKSAFAATFARHLDEADGRDLVYSNEALRFPDNERSRHIVDVATGRGYVPVYIYLVRELAGFALSVYSQLVKRHRETRTFAEFAAGWSPPYAAVIAESEAMFGAGNVQVHNYDAHRDRLADLFVRDIFGLPLTLPAKPMVINRSLGAKELAMMRVVNSLCRSTPRAAAFVSDAITSVDGGDTPLGISPRVAQSLSRHQDEVEFVNARIRGPAIRLVGATADGEEAGLTPVETAMAATLARLVMRTMSAEERPG
ncbi:hypothetical protein [Acuticoccus sediminis]|uniref:hypothetical protein n=1 Tax=Acuticoccus sediminis TaxID=2184697 RepID=UPI001CFF4A5C|nr:hypothetical protein [Acuticoccus sediminis]